MAILQSCCFWRSVRKGSYASAIYTAAYFGVIVVIMSIFVDEERRYYWPEASEDGEVREGEGKKNSSGDGRGFVAEEKGTTPNKTTPRRPMTQSFLEPEGISETTMCFNILVLVCASLGFIASLLLCCGLYIDNRLLLIPWILIVVITSLVDLSHTLYLIVLETMGFNPFTAIVFTMDFFLLSINIYSLLCVVSQYQEYKAGRGTAQYEDFSGRLPVIRYEAPQGAISIMSSKRTMPTSIQGPSTTTVSPTGLSVLLPGAEATTSGTTTVSGSVEGRMLEKGLGRGIEVGWKGTEEEKGERWRTKKRPLKRVQFPEEKRERGLEEEREGEEHLGQGGGPFILEAGRRLSSSDQDSQSAMLFLSSSSVAAAVAVVVATDTAPLLSPKPPCDPSPHAAQSNSRMTFFGGGGGRDSRTVDS